MLMSSRVRLSEDVRTFSVPISEVKGVVGASMLPIIAQICITVRNERYTVSILLKQYYG